MKSKKKMLLALGAMSAAAIGAGATSTFAWFGVTNALKVKGTASDNISVTKADVAIGDVNLAEILKFDLVSTATVTGLAEYDATPATDNSAKTVYLATAYYDEGGTLHHIHGDGGKVLYSKVRVKVSINWDEKGAGTHGWTYPAGQQGDKTKWSYVENGSTYSYATMKAEIAKNTGVTLYIREADTSRARLFKTTAVENNLKLGGFEAGDKTSLDFGAAADYVTAGTVDFSTFTVSDDAFTNPETSVTSSGTGVNYYIYGGTAAGAAAQDDRSAESVAGDFAVAAVTTTYGA